MPGPFVINSKDADSWDWGYSRNPHANEAPTPVQRDFARSVSKRANMVRKFRKTKAAEDVMERIRNVFSVALVSDSAAQADDDDYLEEGTYTKDLEEVDKHILSDLAEPALLTRLKTYYLYMVPAGLFLAAVAFGAGPLVPPNVQAILLTATPYLMTTIGVLIGRALSFVPTMRGKIRTLDEYNDLIFQFRSPVLEVSINILLSCVMALMFIYNFIVLEIGDVGADGVGISSKNIDANPGLALGFGVLLGLVLPNVLEHLIGKATGLFGDQRH